MDHTGYITWKKEYSVGVDEIDNQHKELLNLTNNTINHCTGDKAAKWDYFNRIVRMGIENIRHHFSTEEAIMIKTNYPGLAEHQAEHAAMLSRITELLAEIESGKRELDLLEIAAFIRDWILSHIPSFDKNAAEYFRKGTREQEQSCPNG
jgi:hemerythrin